MTELKQSTLSRRLKELREDNNLSQRDVAQFIEVSERVYSYYEDGRFPKNADTLIKLALHYGVSTDYLLGKSNSKTGGNDNTLRATGLEDESLSAIIQSIKDKDILNKIIQHDRFSLMINLISLYATTDAYKLLAHIQNDESGKLPLSERESALLNAYNASQIQAEDKDNKRLPPLVSIESKQYLRILTLHETPELFESFFLSALDNCLNGIVTDIKKKLNFDKMYPMDRFKASAKEPQPTYPTFEKSSPKKKNRSTENDNKDGKHD